MKLDLKCGEIVGGYDFAATAFLDKDNVRWRNLVRFPGQMIAKDAILALEVWAREKGVSIADFPFIQTDHRFDEMMGK